MLWRLAGRDDVVVFLQYTCGACPSQNRLIWNQFRTPASMCKYLKATRGTPELKFHSLIVAVALGYGSRAFWLSSIWGSLSTDMQTRSFSCAGFALAPEYLIYLKVALLGSTRTTERSTARNIFPSVNYNQPGK